MMIDIESDKNVCNFGYLSETVGGNTKSMSEIMEIFLSQIPEDLKRIAEAIKAMNYTVVKSITHTMKSSVSIMGISILEPILHEMEELASTKTDITRIQQLNQQLNSICNKAINEITKEKEKLC